MTSVVKELLIDFKARGENDDHLILTSCMVLVPGHPLVTSASGSCSLTAAHRAPAHFSARQAQQPLWKGWDGFSAGQSRIGHSSVLHHMEIWSTPFFHGAMNPVLLPDSAILFLSLPELSLLGFPLLLYLHPSSCLSTSFPSPLCPQALSLLWSPRPLCWLYQILLLTLAFRNWHQYLAHDSTVSFHPLGECFTDYKETMNRKKG